MLLGLKKSARGGSAFGEKTVFVAMSGGVDSSVAAALLKRRGADVVGIFMKNWTGPTCTAAEDFESAASVAAALDIPLYSWNFEEEYKSRVFDYTIRECRAGRTPNPDVMCNKEIKFGVFFDRARAAGADYVATGHYARAKRKRLFAGVDRNKDQSYFLWTLTKEHLARTLFPIGRYTKPQVRQLARTFGLPNAGRPDSQGLCFVGKVDWREFLSAYLPANRGMVMSVNGKVLGEHMGIHFYTIGQRHGLGIGGRPAERDKPRPRGAGGTPYYVAAKDAATNTLVVATADEPALYKDSITATDLNWISGLAPELPKRCMARIRYRQPLWACVIERDGGGEERVRVRFKEPQRAVAPGQSIVFYNGDEVIGGGVIE